MNEVDDFELCGIETIARGVCVRDGKVLLCRARGGATTYLPGGHIEFGETGRVALAREIREEMGLDSTVGKFLGVVENSFMQKGKVHAEINLVYVFELADDAKVQTCEDWITFEWRDVTQLNDLLPCAFRKLSEGVCVFEP